MSLKTHIEAMNGEHHPIYTKEGHLSKLRIGYRMDENSDNRVIATLYDSDGKALRTSAPFEPTIGGIPDEWKDILN